MHPTTKELREAYWNYQSVQQRRYDELTAHFVGDPTSDACMAVHKQATERIGLELHAVEIPDLDTIYTSAAHYICGDTIYDMQRNVIPNPFELT